MTVDPIALAEAALAEASLGVAREATAVERVHRRLGRARDRHYDACVTEWRAKQALARARREQEAA